jgi:hypothetical protein
MNDVTQIKWYDRVIIFLGRPLGGFELEAYLLIFGELWFGVTLATADKAVWYSNSLRPFYGEVSGVALSLPWFASALLTSCGFVMFALGNHRCVPLRIAGAAISMWLWFWLAVTTNWITSGEAPYAGLFVGAAIAQFRFIIGAWHRHILLWDRG